MSENRIIRALKGLLWWLAGELVACIFTLCMVLPMRRFMLVRIFAGIASVFLVNALYFNFTNKCAKKDMNAVRYHGAKQDRLQGLYMALTAPLFQYISWIALVLSKAGLIPDIFNIYILSNIQCIAWVDLFTPYRTIDALSVPGLIGLLLLVLIAPATIIITYECTYREIDLKALLMYEKKRDKEKN